MDLSDQVAAAAQKWLACLDEAQQQGARLAFDDDDRRRWVYWPAPRQGVRLGDLDRAAQKGAHRLLASLLPVPAYARAVTIMALDEVLDRLEGFRSDRRNHGDYWLTIFGQPASDLWGVRFEGHHISIHATFSEGQCRITPLFLGANPAVVADDVDAVAAVAPLAPEEQLGFELLHCLPAEQRLAAVISDEAPADIVTRNLPRLDDRTAPATGVPLAALRGGAALGADALLRVYLDRFPHGSLRPDPEGATFAWAGSQEPGGGHYYRIAGPRVLIELDNTQNGANHVHTVVRDPRSDFGEDLLAAHLRHDHG
ncbi:MAG TPA: DUF3500 domain-containing protein [Acidimicrobiales bacterium]|nr:DUF3500 domain-containing protein [Acidimicrobiales bacterium]